MRLDFHPVLNSIFMAKSFIIALTNSYFADSAKKKNYVELNYLWFKQLNKMSIQNKSKIMLTMDGSQKNDVVI